MKIPFIKMHGLGNDYVYLDLFQPEVANLTMIDYPLLARRMSDRHRGVGSDGLVLIMPSDKADVRMRMFNADGSEAEMCGNAARCIAKYAYEKGLCGINLTLETLAGIKHLTIMKETGPQERLVKLEMGTEIGNPHQVFFVKRLESIGSAFKRICSSPRYAELRATTNIECAYVCTRNGIIMRVCERGTGETMACGTGACAVAIEAMDKGLTENEVNVSMPGGQVIVHRDEKGVIYLTGTATTVFTGIFEYEVELCY